MANAMGQFANGLTRHYLKKSKKETMDDAITEAEYNVARRLARKMGDKEGDDGAIDKFEFTLLQLYRLRRTTQDEVDKIMSDFKVLDVDGNGKFSRSEMQAVSRGGERSDGHARLSVPNC